ncbi:similar to RING zinc finger protein [Plenodomus lingam JN3]|uniref:E3 ubiquitin-protein ligase listerin n=1 Tax=Leptosphaeria maculans (strain JN3 / isolate v23.1.3 / race Av1-4-5-6-7-8) TaxID=985895 RepID=E4ZWB7_LEPMJ|nr:similar to RING zinc finger protein [Plenodomus lingam JN3]CBX95893.1 similar to RING zinc finger protein [Plenodomus lingam JN3]
MSKRTTKAHASSARAASTFASSTFGSVPAFGASSSALSYVSEPPDLSAVSDPNVVVYFRNLSKKDSTTKAKALEDIQAYVASLQEPVEEGVLEAWIKTYPRTSIDNAKAVRQNAHLVHGQMALSAGKRIAKHMPKSVAAWLSGLYDSDRSVVEATQTSIRQVFNTPEKIQNIRKAYQQPILEYCKDAIDKESTTTLSDERTVSKDDAETKYSRVISACIALLGSLLANLQPEELSKYQADYDSLLGDKKLWEFVSHDDASIRRSLHRFLKTCLAKQSAAIEANLDAISKSYLSVGLNSDQMSSIYDYIEALTLLTSTHPSVWTNHYKSKTSVDRRLRQFLKKGSQLGPREFWVLLKQLLAVLPTEVLPSNAADAAELLSSLQAGIVRRDESKYNHDAAFDTSIEAVMLISQRLPESDIRKLLEERVVPLMNHYLCPSAETSQWSIPAHTATKLLPKVLRIPGMITILTDRWPQFAQQLIDDIRTSAPEQSKDYDKSQNAVVQHANRFAALQEHVLKLDLPETLQGIVVERYSAIILEALNVLQNRNGKPYGAAGTIAALLRSNRELISSGQTEQELENFVQANIATLILSPSGAYVVDILYSLTESVVFESAWSAALKAVLQEGDSPTRTKALEALLTSSRIPTNLDMAAADNELQSYVKSSVRNAVEGSAEWDSFNSMLQSQAKILSPETTEDVLAYLTQSLSIAQHAPFSLQGLRQIVKSNPSLLREFLGRPQGSALLQGLLRASESPSDEISQGATAINASIQTILAAGSDSKQSIYDLIHRGLSEASQTSVSIETLVSLAKQSAMRGSQWDDMSKFFPTLDDWSSALKPFLCVIPKSSLAITSPLGGAVYLVESGTPTSEIKTISRDADGYTPAYRIAQYVISLLTQPDYFPIGTVPEKIRAAYIHNIATTVQLADDNLGLAGANGLWAEYNRDVEADAIAFVSRAKELVTQQLKELAVTWDEGDSESTLLFWAIKLLSRDKPDTPAEAYYDARVYSHLVSTAIEVAGWKAALTPQLKDILGSIRKTKAVFSLLGFLNAFKEPLAASKACERMCSEIIADLTGLDITTRSEEGLRQLILLNTVLEQEGITATIAKQRLVFFVKHVIPWLQTDMVARPVKAELCRTLGVLIPFMSDMYGDHWADILKSLASAWAATQNFEEHETWMDSPIPFVYASLKLYAQMRKLTQAEGPNDDLLEAWAESEQPIANGLINLLKRSQHFPDEFHQPLKMVNDVLARQIAHVSLDHLEATEELYPLLYVESQPVQQAAFNILHKQIPAAQEQISIDAALEKTTARLPEELLSLIMEAPTVAALAEADFERSVPLPLRGYLLSWLLVFDHLEHASFKVKNDYVEHIKEGEYLPGLLDFTFDFLGHAHNKPVDVSKLDITTYEPEIEPPKKDLQWLLTHLYFLCLRHVPSLTKSWFISCKSRATVVTLEPWTEKFISPPVITAALDSVSNWSDSQASAEPDSPFSIRVAPRAREITASYLVDDQTMSMRISLPPAFPLASANVESLNRVAVNETKWQSWLRTSLGAITIFNGSLIDALTTFKRNVDGAMKGQSECAICYSIVGSDRKLPDKRCQTCKNLFHGSCLFKWFKSSGGSGCPLCRNPFNYG